MIVIDLHKQEKVRSMFDIFFTNRPRSGLTIGKRFKNTLRSTLWKKLALLLVIGLHIANSAASELKLNDSKSLKQVYLSKLTTINLCYVSISASQGVAWYAYEKGIFKKHGLNVNLTFVKGSSNSIPTMLAGEMDFCLVGGAAVVNATLAGAEIAIIAGLYNTFTYSVMVDPKIKSPRDLIGKTMAINSHGGSADVAIRLGMLELGLKPNDINILTVGGHSARLAAMDIGQVSGTVISVPQTLQAKERGYHELLKMHTLNIPYQHTGIATTKRYLKKNQKIAYQLVKAISESVALMKKDQLGTTEVLGKYLMMDVQQNSAILDEAYDQLILNNLVEIPLPTAEGIETILRSKEGNNSIRYDHAADDIIDTTAIQSLMEEGFFERLYGK